MWRTPSGVRFRNAGLKPGATPEGTACVCGQALIARRTDDAQAADFQIVAGQHTGCGHAPPDVGLQRQTVWRFDEGHGRRSFLEETRSPTARLWCLGALGVGQPEVILVDADFEAAGDGDGRCATAASRDRRCRRRSDRVGLGQLRRRAVPEGDFRDRRDGRDWRARQRGFRDARALRLRCVRLVQRRALDAGRDRSGRCDGRDDCRELASGWLWGLCNEAGKLCVRVWLRTTEGIVGVGRRRKPRERERGDNHQRGCAAQSDRVTMRRPRFWRRRTLRDVRDLARNN